MRSRAEVIGRFDAAGDCGRLLYAPLDQPLRYRHTRVYDLELGEGAGPAERAAAQAFVRRVLVDAVSQDVAFGDAPALDGFLFHLDYGMKPGALDLEKEAVLRYHGELEAPGFALEKLTITQRIYVFGDQGAAAGPERFVRDIVNPAIHTWHVSESRATA